MVHGMVHVSTRQFACACTARLGRNGVLLEGLVRTWRWVMLMLLGTAEDQRSRQSSGRLGVQARIPVCTMLAGMCG